MQNEFEVNELDLMVDRMTLTHYRDLAANILARMEAIQARYPEGTFEDGELSGEEEEEAPPPPRRAKPGPKPGKKAKAAKRGNIAQRKFSQSIGLSDALRQWPIEHKGTVVVAEFKAARPDFKPNSIDGVVAGLVKKGEFRRDPDQVGVIHATRNLQEVTAEA